MRLLKFLRLTWNDINHGWHSDIPLCDILFFVSFWYYKFRRRDKRFIANYHKKMRAHNFNYIPCPLCLKLGRKVTIRDCEKEGCNCKWSQRYG